MRHFGLVLYNRVVFISTELTKEQLEGKISSQTKYLWRNRQETLLKNDQFKHPEKYPDLPENKRPTRESKVYNDWFKIEGQDLSLMDFYCLEKNDSRFYEVNTVSFVEDNDVRD